MYEQRLDESDVEMNSLRSQLTELMAVYDDLQVLKLFPIILYLN